MRLWHFTRSSSNSATRAQRSFNGRPRAYTLLLWVLTGWTALSGGALLFIQSDMSKAVAAGLADGPSQRLLGVHYLALAVVYLLIARRALGRLDLLPLGVQSALAAVLAYDWIAGQSDFSRSAFALCVSSLFALLLGAFQLAGDTTLHGSDGIAGREAPASSAQKADFGAPTERLTPPASTEATAASAAGTGTSGKGTAIPAAGSSSDSADEDRLLGA